MKQAVVGVDLGGTNTRAALVDRQGIILHKHKETTHAAEGWEKVVARIVAAVGLEREFAVRSGLSVAGLGVGAPGVIRADNGTVVKSPNFPDWNNLPLKAILERELNLPVAIGNDANIAALGEQWRGAGQDISSMVLVTLGTGVGGGIILDGKIWQGADGMAGEIGHMTLLPEGRLCGCGNRGCLEMYASARGIVMSYREAGTDGSDGITSERIYELARGGDSPAGAVMAGMGRMLGIGLANLINIFNPEMIVIGGGVRDAWPLFIESTFAEIKNRAFDVPAARTRIVPSALGDDAGLVGAAAAAWGISGKG